VPKKRGWDEGKKKDQDWSSAVVLNTRFARGALYLEIKRERKQLLAGEKGGHQKKKRELQ